MKASQQTHLDPGFDTNLDFSQQKVNAQDGMDQLHAELAIYDLMSDRKKRTVTEVEFALAKLGYNRRTVNTAMVGMLYKKVNFAAAPRGAQGANAYTLKKTALRPVPMGVVSKVATKDSDIKIPAAKSKPFLTNPLTAHVVAPQPVVPTLPPIIKEKPAVEVLREEPVALLQQEQTNPPVVQRNDPVQVAIWKVMQDYQPYTLADLAMLLEHITHRTIESNVEKMVEKNMFDVHRVRAKAPAQYTLKPGTPMPTGVMPYQPRMDKRKDVPAPVTEPVVQVETKKEPTPNWDLRLDALQELGEEAKMEQQKRKEQEKRDVAAEQKRVEAERIAAALAKQKAEAAETSRQEAEAEREAQAERERLEQEAEYERVQKEAQDRAQQREQQRFTDPAPVVETAPGVFSVGETPLIQVGGIFIKGRRFGFKDAMCIMEELEALGLDDEEVSDNLHNEKRKFVKMELRISIADMDFTVAEAKAVVIQLKRDLS